MATQAPLSRPALWQSPGTPFATTLPAITDSSNTFSYSQFVKLSSGVLAAYVADDTGIYGLTPDASHTATDEPYTAPYGQFHNPIALRGQTFLMNITDGSGTVGSGSTTLANVTIGSMYSARYLGSIDTGCLAIDASDSGSATKHIFKVVGKFLNTASTGGTFPNGDASDDYNGRVMVSVIEAGIQS
jgi:hypothetical protein